METSSLLDKIHAEDMRYRVLNNAAPKFLLLSAEGYMELIHDLGGTDELLINGLNKHSGMDILVSQDMNFPTFVLAK